MRSLFAFRSDMPVRTSALALILAAVMACAGCWFKAQWINTALQDLPVLIQMAESISSIVALTGQSQASSAQTINAIQNIGVVATDGLKAIQSLYNSYSRANATTTIQQIQAAGAALVSNLQQLLQAAQIKDPTLLARVTAAVNLIASTVNIFIGLIPTTASGARVNAVVPKAADLRQAWAAQVGTPLLAAR